MLTELNIDNFKSLNSLSITLKPLTVFIGPNNSGKSSVIQAITLVKKLFMLGGNTDLSDLLSLDRYVNMGIWEDIAYDKEKPVEIRLAFREEEFEYEFRVSIDGEGKVRESYSVRGEEIRSSGITSFQLPYSKRQSVEAHFTVGSGTSRTTVTVEWDGVRFSPTYEISSKMESLLDILNNWYLKILILPHNTSMFVSPQTTVTFADTETLLKGVCKSLVVDPEYLMALVTLDSNVEDFVMDWMSRLFGLHVRGRVLPGNIGRIITRVRRGRTTIIVNEGGGINRVAFMLAAIAAAKKESLLLIEEPEADLYPRVQYDLAKALIGAISEEKQLLITTHSEHLVLGLFDAIATGRIRGDDIIIYYFTKEGDVTKVSPIEVDRKGRPRRGIPGFLEWRFKS